MYNVLIKAACCNWEVVNPFRGPPAGLKRPGTLDRPSLPGVHDSNSIFMLKFLYDIALKLNLFISSSEELTTWWACDVVIEGLKPDRFYVDKASPLASCI